MWELSVVVAVSVLSPACHTRVASSVVCIESCMWELSVLVAVSVLSPACLPSVLLLPACHTRVCHTRAVSVLLLPACHTRVAQGRKLREESTALREDCPA